MTKPPVLRSQLEEHLEEIISDAALLADSLLTREDRRNRIVQECNILREVLQEFIQYVKNKFKFDKIKIYFYFSQKRKIQMKILMKKFDQYKQKLMIYESRYCFLYPVPGGHEMKCKRNSYIYSSSRL